jgi:hypothetical protein
MIFLKQGKVIKKQRQNEFLNVKLSNSQIQLKDKNTR